MANTAYDSFKENLLNAAYDLNTASIKCSFVRGYTFSASHTFVSDVTGAGGTLNGTSAALATATVIHRPDTGTTVRSASGTVIRPDTGIIERP